MYDIVVVSSGGAQIEAVSAHEQDKLSIFENKNLRNRLGVTRSKTEWKTKKRTT